MWPLTDLPYLGAQAGPQTPAPRPAQPIPQVVNTSYAIGASFAATSPALLVLGKNPQVQIWTSTLGPLKIKPSPEWWLDMSLHLKNGPDWWFSGVNLSILRPLPEVLPMDWQIITSGIATGNLPVTLPRPTFFPYGPAVVVYYHEAAAYGGDASNQIQVCGCYYAV